eukprot:scaffold212253_cov18-Tisochrysis_lutea.AAC.1
MFVPFVPDLSSICQETRSDCPCSSLDKAVQTGCAGLNSFVCNPSSFVVGMNEPAWMPHSI